jgi:glutathione S-transferase
MKHFDLPFQETQVAVAGTGPNERHLGYSENGLVPCLHVEGFQVWDTLAIIEYLAEETPSIWPEQRRARARARSVAAEMHAGFGALRGAMPMNLQARLVGKTPDAAVATDIARLTAIWQGCRQEFGAGGDWLFGRFSAADAMFAPVAWRFETYNVSPAGEAGAYLDRLRDHPAMREWEAAALLEPAGMPYDALAASYGGPRDP